MVRKAVYANRPGEHFALAEPVYAHTTSPIRRYADLVNQRCCAHAWHAGKPAEQPPVSPRLTGDLNQDELFSRDIENDATRRCTALAMDLKKPDEWMAGRIVGVEPFGLFVETDAIPGVQAMCHVSEIDGDWYEMERHGELVREHTGRSWRIGRPVESNFGMINIASRKLDAWVRRPGERRSWQGLDSRQAPDNR